MTRAARILVRFTLGAALGFALGVCAVVGLPNLAGWHSFTVMSGSMTPAILTGDVVVDEVIPASTARIGDVVTFQDPKSPKLITHRVRSVRRQGDLLSFVTKGDANNTEERWSVKREQTIGRVRLKVPKLGYLMMHTRRPEARIGLVAVPVLLLALFELVRIWRPQRPEDARATAA